jgi:hydroxymethylpyrimidine/phosphomethylpyrimidine kinase
VTSPISIAFIGGLDPTGGAGLLRDAWVADVRAPELLQLAVCTALTRQGHGEPASFAATEPEPLARALGRVRDEPSLRAVKLGMIPSVCVPAVIELLVELRARPDRVWVVADPVMLASDGGLLGAEPTELFELSRRVDLLTPNASERDALERVGPLAHTSVLSKGEAVDDRPDRVADRLLSPDGSELVIERPRVSGPDPRGTGCALASAIACELARGRSMVTAVAAGIAWLDGARRRLVPGPDGRWHLKL